MNLTLAVHTEKSKLVHLQPGDGLFSTDRYETQVRRFCDKHGIPYVTPFVSVEVYDCDRDPLGRAGMYGKFTDPVTIVLRPEQVLDDLNVVAYDDFQDVTKQAYDNERLNARIERFMRQLVVLEGDHQARRQQLAEAVLRRSRDYVEARLARRLFYDDVDHIIDDFTRKTIWPSPP